MEENLTQKNNWNQSSFIDRSDKGWMNMPLLDVSRSSDKTKTICKAHNDHGNIMRNDTLLTFKPQTFQSWEYNLYKGRMI